MGFCSMPYGSSQVVGVIDIDANSSMPAWSSPSQPGFRRNTITQTEVCDTVEFVSADLTQIDTELKAELADLVSRIAKGRKCR